ncbi:MAG: GAF domain-containing protein [Planctomycetota bacterium]
MTSVKESSRAAFLKDILIIDVDSDQPAPCDLDLVNSAMAKSTESGFPVIEMSETDGIVVFVVPVFRAATLVSFVVFVAWANESAIGVFESWQPVGDYNELELTSGYFGSLERFQNVSSFVRFEKSYGLPGQVWDGLRFVVHDNLPSHRGFLRAAGASAESLQVAVGMPVYSDTFLASAVLISSDLAPIARAFEAWEYTGGQFVLTSSAYQNLASTLRLEEGAVLTERSLPGLALQEGRATTTTATEVLSHGRGADAVLNGRGVVVPFFKGDQISNVLTLVL